MINSVPVLIISTKGKKHDTRENGKRKMAKHSETDAIQTQKP